MNQLVTILVSDGEDGSISIRRNGKAEEFFSDVGYLAERHVENRIELENLRSEVVQFCGRMHSESCSFRYIVERRHLDDAAYVIDSQEGTIRQLKKALQQIAALGDIMSEAHHKAFNTGPGQPIANGWRVAERMREIAIDVIGSERIADE